MKNIQKNIQSKKTGVLTLLIGTSIFLSATLISSQDKELEWTAPKKASKKISFQKFSSDNVKEGEVLYERACQSCHGVPGKKNFTLMVPSPGDPAGNKFSSQSDGSLYYKIKTGRELMPSFNKAFSEDEIWNIIAYLRKYHKAYVQKMPNLKGIFVPKFDIKLSYDDNVDKLVVKVKIINGKKKKNKGVKISAYIKSMFGKLSLGTQKTKASGIAYFNVDSNIPGDKLGNLTAIVKVRKGYGFAKKVKKLKMGKRNTAKSAIAGRHIWSTRSNTPLWLGIFFPLALLSIWGLIIFVLYRLKQIKKFA